MALTGADRLRPSLDAKQVAALSRLLVAVDSLYGTLRTLNGVLKAINCGCCSPAHYEDPGALDAIICDAFHRSSPLAWALVEEGFTVAQLFVRADESAAFCGSGLRCSTITSTAIDAVELTPTARHDQDWHASELIAAIPALLRPTWVLELPLTWSRDLDHYLLGIGELMAKIWAITASLGAGTFVLRVKSLGAEFSAQHRHIHPQRTLYRVLHTLLGGFVGNEQAPRIRQAASLLRD